MPRLSFAGFKDPVRRPRYIVWTFTLVLAMAAVMIVALGATSTYWFCAEACHKVQDDTITAYQHSSHKEIACMACHMPVNADPVTFILHKAEALGELYLTVTDNFELPLNGESHVALTMPSEQCTQCHELSLREVTPSEGIVIDHDVHSEAGVTCAICHNRVAHREDFALTLTDPKTDEPNKPHTDFMSMTACFRCHTQETAVAESDGETQSASPDEQLTAPGACDKCHTPDFSLKPPSHSGEGFYPAGHAILATEEASRVAAAEREVKEDAVEGAAESEASERQHGEEGEGIGPSLPKVESLNICETCHSEEYCSDCHGLPMPHPEEFQEEHSELGQKNPEACVNCHGDADLFCDECHHGGDPAYVYVVGRPWLSQHPEAVKITGANACFDDCHDPTYCAVCHVTGSAP